MGSISLGNFCKQPRDVPLKTALPAKQLLSYASYFERTSSVILSASLFFFIRAHKQWDKETYLASNQPLAAVVV
jgi:hypothetical protein